MAYSSQKLVLLDDNGAFLLWRSADEDGEDVATFWSSHQFLSYAVIRGWCVSAAVEPKTQYYIAAAQKGEEVRQIMWWDASQLKGGPQLAADDEDVGAER